MYLADFHNGSFYNPKNTVIVGGRDIDPLEQENLKDAGVTVFTTEEVREKRNEGSYGRGSRDCL